MFIVCLSMLQSITNTTEPPENNDRIFILKNFSNLNDVVSSIQQSLICNLEGWLKFELVAFSLFGYQHVELYLQIYSFISRHFPVLRRLDSSSSKSMGFARAVEVGYHNTLEIKLHQATFAKLKQL